MSQSDKLLAVFSSGVARHRAETSGKANASGSEIVIENELDGQYVGEKLNGVPHGIGVKRFRSGAEYAGSWKNGLIDGYGKYVHPNGSIHWSVFERGERSGVGVYAVGEGGGAFEVTCHGKKISFQTFLGVKWDGTFNRPGIVAELPAVFEKADSLARQALETRERLLAQSKEKALASTLLGKSRSARDPDNMGNTEDRRSDSYLKASNGNSSPVLEDSHGDHGDEYEDGNEEEYVTELSVCDEVIHFELLDAEQENSVDNNHATSSVLADSLPHRTIDGDEIEKSESHKSNANKSGGEEAVGEKHVHPLSPIDGEDCTDNKTDSPIKDEEKYITTELVPSDVGEISSREPATVLDYASEEKDHLEVATEAKHHFHGELRSAVLDEAEQSAGQKNYPEQSNEPKSGDLKHIHAIDDPKPDEGNVLNNRPLKETPCEGDTISGTPRDEPNESVPKLIENGELHATDEIVEGSRDNSEFKQSEHSGESVAECPSRRTSNVQFADNVDSDNRNNAARGRKAYLSRLPGLQLASIFSSPDSSTTQVQSSFRSNSSQHSSISPTAALLKKAMRMSDAEEESVRGNRVNSAAISVKLRTNYELDKTIFKRINSPRSDPLKVERKLFDVYDTPKSVPSRLDERSRSSSALLEDSPRAQKNTKPEINEEKIVNGNHVTDARSPTPTSDDEGSVLDIPMGEGQLLSLTSRTFYKFATSKSFRERHPELKSSIAKGMLLYSILGQNKEDDTDPAAIGSEGSLGNLKSATDIEFFVETNDESLKDKQDDRVHRLREDVTRVAQVVSQKMDLNPFRRIGSVDVLRSRIPKTPESPFIGHHRADVEEAELSLEKEGVSSSSFLYQGIDSLRSPSDAHKAVNPTTVNNNNMFNSPADLIRALSGVREKSTGQKGSSSAWITQPPSQPSSDQKADLVRDGGPVSLPYDPLHARGILSFSDKVLAMSQVVVMPNAFNEWKKINVDEIDLIQTSGILDKDDTGDDSTKLWTSQLKKKKKRKGSYMEENQTTAMSAENPQKELEDLVFVPLDSPVLRLMSVCPKSRMKAGLKEALQGTTKSRGMWGFRIPRRVFNELFEEAMNRMKVGAL